MKRDLSGILTEFTEVRVQESSKMQQILPNFKFGEGTGVPGENPPQVMGEQANSAQESDPEPSCSEADVAPA